MSDLLLNSGGDLLIENGLLKITPTIQEATKQRLLIKMRTYLGEWYLDLSQGVPYFQTILRKGTPKDVVDTIFRTIIIEDENIRRIDKFSSRIQDNIYFLDFTAVVETGQIVVLAEQIEF